MNPAQIPPTVATHHPLDARHPPPATPTCARLASSSRDPAHQWLVLEPNRIENQYWKDLWRYRELFAILA